ncbi:unnamed protein product [Arabis nemorensis]|uniref:Uncharacterized protein n=1 Tax=Arabis nemorensis TaxID=586526 RepID=A0A565B8H0_9BRAS|nr:unnamed protein product [Arabis nemorensis]
MICFGTTKGLASISIDATTKKVNESYLISVFKTIVRRGEYGASVRRFLPAALADLKAKRYVQAVSNMKEVVTAPSVCGDQWAGQCLLPLAGRNKDVHDIADMTIDIIRTFVN